MANVVVKLDVPVDLPEKDHATEIVFLRRMNGGDLAAVGLSLSLGDAEMVLTAEQANKIAVRCTGLPLACIEKLDASDWLKLYGTIAGFFAPPTTSGLTE